MNKKIKVVSLILCLVVITGCSKKSINTSQNTVVDSKFYVKQLTSNEFEGRLTGTSGNLKATEFIEKQFKKIGLKPYKENKYLFNYEHAFYNPEKSISSMKIVLKNGDVKTLKYGIDYMERLTIDNVSIDSELTFDVNDLNLKEKIIMIDDDKRIEKALGIAKLIILRGENLQKNISDRTEGTPIIMISDSFYNSINFKDIKSIAYNYHQQKEIVQAQNVIGKIISNEQNENAIVISAHFDHVGKINNQVYYGALDNASGISTMLNVANQIQLYTNKKNLSGKFDVVFCAFNGEDSGLQGSKSFSKEIKNQYKNVYVINIDVIGVKNDNTLLLIGKESPSLDFKKDIYNYFSSKKISCNTNKNEYTSDHVSFEEQNIEAITIGQTGPSFLHTTKDTMENIDFNFLNNVASNVSKYIIEKADNFISTKTINRNFSATKEFSTEAELTPEETEKLKKVNIAIENEKKSLQAREYKVKEVDGNKYVIFNALNEYNNDQNLKKDYEDIDIPASLVDFKINKIKLIDNSLPKIDENTVLNKIYTRKLERKNLSSISLIYSRDDSQILELVFNKIILQNKNDSDNSLNKIDFVYNGEQYYFLKDKSNNILSINKDFSINNEKWIVSISMGKEKIIMNNGKSIKGLQINWFNNSEEKIKLFLDELQVTTYMKKIFVS